LSLVALTVGSAAVAAPARAAAALAPSGPTNILSWNLCGSVCWKLGAAGSQYPRVDFRGEVSIRAAKVARAVSAHRATVLLTQETCAGQYTAILRVLGPGWYGSFKRTSDSGNCRGGSRKVGLAIFTKGRHSGYRYTLLDADPVRNWFMVCVDWSGVAVCNTHVRAYVSAEVKQAQTRTMLAAVGGGTARAIIGGDFNQIPSAPGISDMTAAGFRDVDGADNEPTSPGSVYKIDYIFVRTAAALNGDSASYGPGSISDHRLLRGAIAWN
jgi:endonuclease/exonuclease/phosphatase family metal-dependent hydrolase